MLKIIKKHYLLPFIVFLLLFTVICFVIGSPNSLEKNTVVGVIFAFTLSLLTGTVSYFMVRKEPVRKEHLLNASPFPELRINGFEERGENFIGIVDGYTVVFKPIEWSVPCGLAICVLFDPRHPGSVHSRKIIYTIKQRQKPNLPTENFPWSGYCLTSVIDYPFGRLTYEKVIAKAKDHINNLVVESLKPISYEDASKLILTNENEIK